MYFTMFRFINLIHECESNNNIAGENNRESTCIVYSKAILNTALSKLITPSTSIILHYFYEHLDF